MNQVSCEKCIKKIGASFLKIFAHFLKKKRMLSLLNLSKFQVDVLKDYVVFQI